VNFSSRPHFDRRPAGHAPITVSSFMPCVYNQAVMGTDKTLAVNRKARHDYAIDEAWRPASCSPGTEIKSLRAGQVNIAQSYAGQSSKGELWLYQRPHRPVRRRQPVQP